MKIAGRPASFIFLALTFVTSSALAAGTAGDPAGHVDPFIGTGGHGHTYPGATLPFGMVQLSPDTRLEGWDGCSGYHFTDDVVYGFSHTHLSGTGVSDYGDVLFMPTTGEPHFVSGYPDDSSNGYASRFDKRSERAEPGWYAVSLADYGIEVELTATERTGLHRYLFPAGPPGQVIVDLVHRDEVLDSTLRVLDERTIEGFRRSTGWARDQIVHFAAQFSRPFLDAALVRDDNPLGGPWRQSGETSPSELSGTNVKGVFFFGDSGGELLVRVGISSVDAAGARRNLEAESTGRDFDSVRRAARRSWNEALSRIEVEGGTETERTLFYTALYHSLIAPNVFSDVDGRYRGMDRRIHRAEGRRHYTVFSLWDTFRATHPLYTLIEPVRTREFVETFLAQYREGGRLPVWELAGNETDTMIGYHSVSVIADAWIKGIRAFDEELALEAMLDSAGRDHFGLAAYRRQGFVGGEDDSESVSKTLEYGYDDWCIARMAEGIGHPETAQRFDERSQAWRHLFDPATGFLRPRINQRWLEPFDPRRVDNHYTEANAWQYAFFVPHDVGGLIEALGGDERFVSRLDELFTADSETLGRAQPDITGLIGQYAHGNEPSHHMAWLYHYAGRPDRSAERVREILDSLYSAAPDGLSGNEDCGQMSSWYVFSAMGLYPVCPCSPDYALAGPLFDRVTLNLHGGRRFTISAERDRPGDLYVLEADLDGKPLERSFLTHAEIAAGGELRLKLGARPESRWGRKRKARPGTTRTQPRVLASPFVRSESDRFRDSLSVELDSADPAATIRYSLDPDLPRDEWPAYRRPIELRESTRIRFAAERYGRRSPIVESYLHRIPNDWTIALTHPPAPQYSAGGAQALIDGLRGNQNWRIGGWHGYQSTDFEATVDLGEVRPIRSAGASFLQDIRSWIWMPVDVTVSVSEDGKGFRTVSRQGHDVPEDHDGVVVRTLVGDLEEEEARYVRILARGYGKIPEWHPGRGGKAWIFVDEILIE